MNTSGTHQEQDGNTIIEIFHPSWLYIWSSHWLHAYPILKHTCQHFICLHKYPFYNAYHTYCHIFFGFGLVWFCFLSSFFFIFFVGQAAWAFAPQGFWVQVFFPLGMVLSLCPCRFEITFVFIILAFILQVISQGMSKMLTFLLVSFSRLARLFYFCKCFLFLCFSLVLFFWFYSSCFFRLVSGLVYFHFKVVRFISCVLLCFIRSFETKDEIRQVFRLPLDQIARDSTNKLISFLFLLLPRWCLRYI